MKYFDAHCHLQFEGYDEDREELFTTLAAEEIGGVLVGVDLDSSRKAIALAKTHEGFAASVGLHPNDVHEPFDFKTFLDLAEDTTVVAIGECGLDYYRPEEPEAAKQKQKEIFEQHLQIAVQTDKPLMIHARPSKGTQDAYEDLLAMLESYKRDYGEKLRGDIHFFVGGPEEARRFVELGFTLSYTAVVTFARDYDEAIRAIPAAHLLTETDSPFVAPAPNRGKRNDPRAVKAVVEKLAEIRGEDAEKLRIQVLENAKRLFGV